MRHWTPSGRLLRSIAGLLLLAAGLLPLPLLAACEDAPKALPFPEPTLSARFTDAGALNVYDGAEAFAIDGVLALPAGIA